MNTRIEDGIAFVELLTLPMQECRGQGNQGGNLLELALTYLKGSRPLAIRPFFLNLLNIRLVSYGVKTLVSFAVGITLCAGLLLGQEVDRSFLDEWKFVGNTKPDVPINGLAVSDEGVFIAVGDQGVILRSENETVWLLQYPDTDAKLEQVVFADGQFFVVASDPGQILTSKDGFAWDIQSFPEFDLKNLAVGDFGYLAAGDNGRHLFSSDGVAWQETNSADTGDATKSPVLCAFIDGAFQLLEFVEQTEPSPGSSIHASRFSSSLEWSVPIVSLEETHGPGTREVTSANYASGLTVLTLGSEGFLTSRDYENWTAPDLSDQIETGETPIYRHSFYHDGLHYVSLRMFSGQNPLSAMFTSEDGDNWERIPLRIPPVTRATLSIGEAFYASLNSSTGVIIKVVDMRNVNELERLYIRGSNTSIRGIDFDGKTLIAGGFGRDGEIWVSENGVNWSQQTIPIADYHQLNDVKKVGNRWVINATLFDSHYAFNKAFVSKDGIEWKASSLGNSVKTVYSDGYYVGLTEASTFAPPPEKFRVYRSRDFEAWEEIILPDSSIERNHLDVEFHRGRLWLTSSEGGVPPYDFYYSDDVGETWTFHDSLSGSDSPLTLVGDRFVRVDEDGFSYSENGFDWNSIKLTDTQGDPVFPNSPPLAYENGLYFGLGAEAEIEVYGEEGLLTRHSRFGGLVFAFGRAIAYGNGNIAVSQIAPWADRTRLVNLSSRCWASSGEDSMVAGIVAVPGEGQLEENNLVMRGIGPGLETHGVGEFAPDPRVRYFYNTATVNEVLFENEDWGGGSELAEAFESVGAFTLDPLSMDAAVLGSPVPNEVTFLNVQDDEGGIALVEAYRVDDANFEFFNLSTRALASEGEKTLIGGFVLEGETIHSLLIRGIGPSLRDRGVSNPMEDPVLTLYQGSEVLATNRGWDRSSISRHFFERANASPLEDSADDAVLIVTLNPGQYTVHVSSESGQDGVVLLELFDLGD